MRFTEFVRRGCLPIQPEQLTKTRYLGRWSNTRRASYMSPCLVLLADAARVDAGLGAMLATELFDKRVEIAIAPAMYTFGCMQTGTVLASYWNCRKTNTAN